MEFHPERFRDALQDRERWGGELTCFELLHVDEIDPRSLGKSRLGHAALEAQLPNALPIRRHGM